MENTTKAGNKTTIDSMLDLLKSKGRMDINTISTTLDIAPGVIEDWAKILESGNLVSISYEFGHMFISPKKEDVGQKTEVSEVINIEKSKAVQDIEFEALKVNNLKNKIDSLHKDTNELEGQFSKNFPQLHKSLDEVEKVFKKTSDMSKKLDQLKKRAEKEYKETVGKYESEYKEFQKVLNRSVDTAKIEQMINDTKKFEEDVTNLENNRKNEIESLRKNMDDQIKQIKENLDTESRKIYDNVRNVSKGFKDELNSLSEWNNIAKKTNKKLPALISEMEAEFKKFTEYRNNVSEMYTEIEKEIDQINKDFNDRLTPLSESIDDIRKRLSEPGEVGNSILNAKHEIAEVHKEMNDLDKEFSKLNRELKSISKNKKLTDEMKLGKIKDISKRNDEIKDKINKTDSRVKGVAGMLESIGVGKDKKESETQSTKEGAA